MTRVWHDGFENEQSLDAIAWKYQFVLLGAFSIVSGQRFGSAFQGDDHTNVNGHTFSTPQFTPAQTWIFGMRLAAISANADPRVFWVLKSVLSVQIQAWVRRATPTDLNFHYFGVDVGGTVLAVTAPITNGEHHYHEFKVKVDPSEGYFEWRIDGQLFVSLENINTALEGTSVADQIQFLSPHLSIDDIYINNSSGSENNDFEGEQIIEGFFASADSGPNEWTPSSGSDHAAMVDELDPDEHTTYLEDSIGGKVEKFDHSALTQIDKNITAVRVCAQTFVNAAGSRGMKLSIGEGDDEQISSEKTTTGNTDWFHLSNYFPLSPAGLPWKKSEVDSAPIGVESVP